MKKVISWNSKSAKVEYLSRLMNDEKKVATMYRKEQGHTLGEYINHSKFGFGFIQRVTSDTTINVFFESFEKVLVQNWRKK